MPSFLTRLFDRRRTAATDRSVGSAAHRVKERRIALLWRVTAPISLRRQDDPRISLELQPGASLRYEGSRWGNDYWNGPMSWTERHFLVLDGEHEGHMVTHTHHADEDAANPSLSGAFPPAGLEAAPLHVGVHGQSLDHQ